MRHVVIGGGIGGVCCAEELRRLAPAGDEVVLVAASRLLKGVAGVVRLSPHVEEFTVVEADAAALAAGGPGARAGAGAAAAALRVVRGWAARVDLAARTLTVALVPDDDGGGGGDGGDGGEGEKEASTATTAIAYDTLCVCAGARPRLVARHPRVVALRDTESAADLAARLAGARRLVVVGNGGIALELM